jgi:hypothetical protein
VSYNCLNPTIFRNLLLTGDFGCGCFSGSIRCNTISYHSILQSKGKAPLAKKVSKSAGMLKPSGWIKNKREEPNVIEEGQWWTARMHTLQTKQHIARSSPKQCVAKPRSTAWIMALYPPRLCYLLFKARLPATTSTTRATSLF